MQNTTSPRKAKHLPGLIQPVDYLETLWKHLTESLCEEVFAMTRDRERQRVWSLFTLVQFWIGLLHHPSMSQTRAIEESHKGSALFPEVAATPESFFQRIQSLRPAFFQNLFQRFVQARKSSFWQCRGCLKDSGSYLVTVMGAGALAATLWTSFGRWRRPAPPTHAWRRAASAATW